MAKHVFILTYYWPPASGPGVQRWLKFVKYLVDFGWNVTVITPAEGSYPFEDQSLCDEIPDAVQEIRTKTIEPFRIYNLFIGRKGKSVPVAMGDIKAAKSPFKKLSAYIRANWFIPDARKGWVPFVVKAATPLIKAGEVDAIISTGPPHSTHLAARKLKEKYGIPWVADLRDPWTTIYYNKYLPRTNKTKERDTALETAVLRESDAVLTVSPGLKEELADRARRVEVVYNGFDPEDLPEQPKQGSKYFTLAYIGNLKDNQDVSDLWQAIQELAEEGTNFKRQFRLKLIGSQGDHVMQSISQAGITNFCEIHDFVPHKEATHEMVSASMLLFIIPKSERNNLILTGKIFEYLASRTPMLSIGPPAGNAAQILMECNRTEMLDYGDKDAMKRLLKSAFEKWELEGKGESVSGNEHMIYSRQAQTECLSELLNEITV